MKHEFHAQYSLFLQPDFAQREGVDFLTGAPDQVQKYWRELGEVDNAFARIELLAQAISTPYKDYARVGTRDIKGGLLRAITSDYLNNFFEWQFDCYLEPLKLNPTIPDLTIFPSGSWAINFNFKLQKPYLSKDDTDFYIIDNPIRKEWVFKLPYIAPSQWKGALRAVMVQQLVERSDSLSDTEFADRRFNIAMLFGDEKGEETGKLRDIAKYLDETRPKASSIYKRKVRKCFSIEDDKPFPSHAGLLHFYPTYFTKIGLEMINPHDRETGAGSQPIYFESVPAGAEGVFTLLYVPVNCIGDGDAGIDERSALCQVAEGLRLMLTEYGFGAKTSSGYGVAKDSVDDGKLVLNGEGIEFSEQGEVVVEPPDEFHKYLNFKEGMVQKQFCEDDGKPMRNKKYNKLAYNGETPEGGGSQNEFKHFLSWYKNLGEAWGKSVQSKNDSSSAELLSYEFKNFNDLMNLANTFKRIVNEKGD